MTGYPLLLDLTGRRVLVVGGGAVALRRARGLVQAGAAVEVVAPAVRAELAGLDVGIRRRPYASGDVAGAWLVEACTDDPRVNAAVAADAAAAGVFCVRADAADQGSASTPATARAGGLTVAVSAGGDPRRAVAVRDAIGLLLETADLPVRRERRPGGEGEVALVGGGPGDPGLITVRGRQLLAAADVVVVDRLGPRGLLAGLDDRVEVVEAGKSPHGQGMTQEEINAVLVDRALAGARVVRLKGGDPFVFGRGGEEMLACAQAGVAVQVVPGVTSAIAVPAAAGIPVTHRGITQDFAVVSAHLDPSQPGSTVDWDALANGPGTLVLLMAVSRLEVVARELVKRGRPATTPVAVIASGTTPAQQVVTADLATIAAVVAAAGIEPPAVTVIGAVVRLREDFGWPA